ncbi:MAG TPA: hypothetical protein HA224_02305 [Nanoarchaeota archaeon]|nr:hypothetical protein [Nanoarchaeota archaeon]
MTNENQTNQLPQTMMLMYAPSNIGKTATAVRIPVGEALQRMTEGYVPVITYRAMLQFPFVAGDATQLEQCLGLLKTMASMALSQPPKGNAPDFKDPLDFQSAAVYLQGAVELLRSCDSRALPRDLEEQIRGS